MNYPTLDECYEFIEWMEDHNDIDLNQVRFRVRELDEGSGKFFITVLWLHRLKSDKPKASELLCLSGWIIEKWFWNGEVWSTGFWREPS